MSEILCPYCGHRAPLVWVHGHGQCARCKLNIDECCRGETVCPETLQTQQRHIHQ